MLRLQHALLLILTMMNMMVEAQKCADGVDAFVECDTVCKSDPTLNCEQISGKGYCCGYGTTVAPASTPSGGGGGCKDVVPDECKRKSFLCNPQRFEYKRLMQKYCSLTCSYCQPAAQPPAKQQGKPAAQNQAKPAVAGCSDKNTKCAQQKDLCTAPKYQTMMALVCKATCGKC